MPSITFERCFSISSQDVLTGLILENEPHCEMLLETWPKKANILLTAWSNLHLDQICTLTLLTMQISQL